MSMESSSQQSPQNNRIQTSPQGTHHNAGASTTNSNWVRGNPKMPLLPRAMVPGMGSAPGNGANNNGSGSESSKWVKLNPKMPPLPKAMVPNKNSASEKSTNDDGPGSESSKWVKLNPKMPPLPMAMVPKNKLAASEDTKSAVVTDAPRAAATEGAETKPAYLTEASMPSASLPTRSEVQAAQMEEKTPLEWIKYYAEQRDAEKLLNQILTASEEDLRAAANDKMTILRIFKLTDIEKRNCILDSIYDGIEDVKVLTKALEVRFGVHLGLAGYQKVASPEHVAGLRNKKKTIRENGRDVEKTIGELDKQWTPNGIIHLYKTYLRLPQSDLDFIQSVLTLDTTSGSGGASFNIWDENGKSKASGVYHVDYKDTKIDKEEAGHHTDMKAVERYSKYDENGQLISKGIADSRNGLNLTDMTIAHELGHIVDSRGGYSEMDSFRELNGWKEYPLSNAEEIYRLIKNSMITPYESYFSEPFTMTPYERLIVDACGETAIKDQADNDMAIRNAVDKRLATVHLNPTEGDNRGGRSKFELIDALCDSAPFKYLIGWKCFPTGHEKEFFASLKADKPFNMHMTPEESRIADLCGEEVLRHEANDKHSIWRIVLHTVLDEYKTNAGGKKHIEDTMTENGEIVQGLKNDILDTRIMSFLPRFFASRTPWYSSEPAEYMTTQQIHQGYENQSFYAYPTASLNGKISKYQFRNPKEDFAETYATFFVANPIGSKTPSKHREWFIKIFF